MDPLTQMNCPACGGPALVQESVTTLRCENCNSIVQRSSSTSFLEILGIGCYSCGAVNDKGIKYCTNCGIELIVDCPGCDKLIVLGQKRCGNCGIDIFEEYKKLIENLEQRIEENCNKISHNEKIIEDHKRSMIKTSKLTLTNLFPLLIFSIIGTQLIITIIGEKWTSDNAVLFLIFCTAPIFTGLFYVVYRSKGLNRKELEKQINSIKEVINQFNKTNISMDSKITNYKNYSKSYIDINN